MFTSLVLLSLSMFNNYDEVSLFHNYIKLCLIEGPKACWPLVRNRVGSLRQISSRCEIQFELNRLNTLQVSFTRIIIDQIYRMLIEFKVTKYPRK